MYFESKRIRKCQNNLMDLLLKTIFFTESHLDEQSSASLLCVQCKDAFQNAWDLMVHAQAAHMLNIYELGVPNGLGNCSSRPQTPRDNTTPDKVRKYINVLIYTDIKYSNFM